MLVTPKGQGVLGNYSMENGCGKTSVACSSLIY